MKFRSSLLVASAATLLLSLLPSVRAAESLPLSQPPSPSGGATALKSLDMTAGRLRVTMGAKANLRLLLDGVPVITESSFYLVKPGWTGMVLNPSDVTPRFTRETNGDVQIGTAVFENADGYARYRLEVRPDSTLTIQLTYGTNGAPAQVEYAAGFLSANLIAGRAFRAETVEGARSGTVPSLAASADQTASRLTPFFRRMQFDSLLGQITITAAGNTPASEALNLFDSRKGAQEWAVRYPTFWIGIGSPALNVTPGENVSTLTFGFGPAPVRPAAAAAGGVPVITDTKTAQIPFTPDRTLIPRPKESENGTSPLRLKPGKTRIVIPAEPIAEERRGAAELQADLKTFWSLDIPVASGVAPSRGDLVLGRASVLRAAAPERPEGYLLRVTETGAILAGNDPRGVYNAAQTAKQLIRVDADGVYLKPITIRDWPTLLSRGVHWYGGPNSWPFHERMISRIIAPLKYNEMVYEVENSRWKSQPGIYDDRSTPLDQIKKTVDYAREHLIEAIPLVNSFGHMEWLFVNKQNLDIAADPTHPYAIDPDNPRTYKALFGVMDEAIALFQPKRLHIGHDEVTLVGTFPKAGSKKTVTDLLIQNVNTIHSWLAKKNIRTMMWGDMLLHPGDEGSGGAAFAPSREESARRRAGIPKNIQMADWHYWANGLDYPSVAVLQKDGFEVIAAPWLNPTNISDFAQVAAKEKSRGLLQTTWAGWKMSVEGVKGESFGQFVAYLIAAEHAWNGGANDFETLGYNPQDAFLSLWDRQPVDRHTRGGFAVDLASVGSASGPDFGLTGEKTLGGIQYLTGKAVHLSGPLNPAGAWPDAVVIQLGSRKVTALRWLWGTSHVAITGTSAAKLTITYADGKTLEVPVVYGKQISAFTDRRGSSETRSVGSGRGASGELTDLRDWCWLNPRPDVPLTRVTLSSANTEASPVLLGLTGIE